MIDENWQVDVAFAVSITHIYIKSYIFKAV